MAKFDDYETNHSADKTIKSLLNDNIARPMILDLQSKLSKVRSKTLNTLLVYVFKVGYMAAVKDISMELDSKMD